MPGPFPYEDRIGTIICNRIADGESLRSICRDEGMPSKALVLRWVGELPSFRDQYVRAREAQADGYFEEIVDIADDGQRDYTVGEDGQEFVNHDHIQRARLRVDARKWVAARMAPKKYGDMMRQPAPTDADEPNPLTDPNPDV